MKVREAMTELPSFCRVETNLGSAAELMWNANCGFLPVQNKEGKVVGVVTDRDMCIALGTRNRLPGDISVGEVMSGTLFACGPADDVHTALQTMRSAKVRRLPVIEPNGSLVGVISMDDIVSEAESAPFGKKTGISVDEVVRTFQQILHREAPQKAVKQIAAA